MPDEMHESPAILALRRELLESAREFQDQIVDLERALTGSLLALLRKVADTHGWTDEDITSFLLDQAQLLREDPLRASPHGESRLADRLETAARDLAPPGL